MFIVWNVLEDQLSNSACRIYHWSRRYTLSASLAPDRLSGSSLRLPHVRSGRRCGSGSRICQVMVWILCLNQLLRILVSLYDIVVIRIGRLISYKIRCFRHLIGITLWVCVRLLSDGWSVCSLCVACHGAQCDLVIRCVLELMMLMLAGFKGLRHTSHDNLSSCFLTFINTSSSRFFRLWILLLFTAIREATAIFL